MPTGVGPKADGSQVPQVPRQDLPRGWGQLFENNYFIDMCSFLEAGSYLRLIDHVYHSTLGLRVIKKKKRSTGPPKPAPESTAGVGSAFCFSDLPRGVGPAVRAAAFERKGDK